MVLRVGQADVTREGRPQKLCRRDTGFIQKRGYLCTNVCTKLSISPRKRVMRNHEGLGHQNWILGTIQLIVGLCGYETVCGQWVY